MSEIWKSNMLNPLVGHILATSIEDGWYQALDMVMTRGDSYLITGGSYEGIRRRTMPLIVEMHNPSVRPLAPLMPEGSNIPPPTTDEKIQKYMEYLISAERQPNEHYTYGEDLSWLIEEVLRYFKKHGHGSACGYMTIGRPETIFHYNREVDYEEVITVRDRQTQEILTNRRLTNLWNRDEKIEVSSQCLRGIDVFIRGSRIIFWCYFRSQDLWGGFPENYGGIQLVKEYMGAALEIADGPIIASSKDLHVYEHGWPIALMRIRKEERKIL